MTDKKKIIERIRKLLALAGDKANEHVAAMAAEKAQAMLAEFNLSEADVQDQAVDFTIDGGLKTDSVPWRRPLAVVLAEMYFCRYFFKHTRDYIPSRPNGYVRYDIHCFVGASHNVEIVKAIFTYLSATVERLAREGAVKYPIRERSSYMTSFKAACALRLQKRIQQRIADAKKGGVVKTETGTTLPALASMYDRVGQQLQAYLEEQFPHLKEKKQKVTQSHWGGAREGWDAGAGIGLDKNIAAGAGNKHLLGN